MAYRFVDVTGLRFGKLVVLEQSGTRIRNGKGWPLLGWRCRCDCSKEVIVDSSRLRKGNTLSCGCGHLEQLKRFPESTTKHGLARHSSYKSWGDMLQRCENSKCPSYKHYGGRGIVVCDRWHDLDNFIADMGERPSKEHSLDRIDVDGNYEPGNCRWATRKQQNDNRRKRARIEQFSNEELLREFCKRGAFWADVPLSFGG